MAVLDSDAWRVCRPRSRPAASRAASNALPSLDWRCSLLVGLPLELPQPCDTPMLLLQRNSSLLACQPPAACALRLSGRAAAALSDEKDDPGDTAAVAAVLLTDAPDDVSCSSLQLPAPAEAAEPWRCISNRSRSRPPATPHVAAQLSAAMSLTLSLARPATGGILPAPACAQQQQVAGAGEQLADATAAACQHAGCWLHMQP